MSDCTCPEVHLNSVNRLTGETVTGTGVKNWSPRCEVHGLESEWWRSPEQVAKREAQSIRLRDLQRQAREARAAARSTDDHD